MTVELDQLTTDEKWAYFKWQWLRRNKLYAGQKKGSEGVFYKFNSAIELAEKKHQSTPKRRMRVQKLLKSEFSATCGLKHPVDPTEEDWKRCSWTSIDLALLIRDIQEYGNYRGNAKNLEIRKASKKFNSLRGRCYQFPRGVKVILASATRERQDDKVTFFRSSLTVVPELNITIPRMRTDEFALGLVIWDIMKAERNAVSYKEIASALKIPVTGDYSNTGTANKTLQRLRDRFQTTIQQIHQSMNPDLVIHWKHADKFKFP